MPIFQRFSRYRLDTSSCRPRRAGLQQRAQTSPCADEPDSIDTEMRERLRSSGLVDVVVPGQFGGRFDQVDALAVTVVREALAGESAHLDSMFAMQGIGSYGRAGGSPELRAEWLPKVATLDAIAALGLTEPHVGSDLKALTSTIVEREGMLVVNGHKSLITNGGDADFYSILAREGDGYSLVLVPAGTVGSPLSGPTRSSRHTCSAT